MVPSENLRSPVEVPAVDVLAVDVRDREPAEPALLDVHPGFDPEYVLVPDWFEHGDVAGNDASLAFERIDVFLTGLAELAPDMPVANSAPQGALPRGC